MLYSKAARPRYSLIRQTAPSIYPITQAEVKAQSVINFSDDDTLLDGLIAAATGHLDGADGWLGRCLVEQTWDLKIDGFPACDGISIPLAPLISVDQITYVDGDGATQTLASSVYQVVGVGAANGGWVTTAYGQSWPGTRDIPEAVTIRFTAGYASTADSPPVSQVPEPIKRAMVIIINELYENRGDASLEGDIPEAAKALLHPYRVHWFG